MKRSLETGSRSRWMQCWVQFIDVAFIRYSYGKDSEKKNMTFVTTVHIGPRLINWTGVGAGSVKKDELKYPYWTRSKFKTGSISKPDFLFMELNWRMLKDCRALSKNTSPVIITSMVFIYFPAPTRKICSCILNWNIFSTKTTVTGGIPCSKSFQTG